MNFNDKVNHNKLVIPLLGAPGVRLTETTLKENLHDPEIQYRSLSQLIERFSLDGIFPLMDLTVEAEALGLKVKYKENDNPAVNEHPIENKTDLKKLQKKWYGINSRMRVFTDLMEKMSKNFSVIKGGYVIGPFSLAGELMGVSSAVIKVLTDSDFVKEVVDFCTIVVSEYTSALFDAGADTVMVLEPTPVLLSPGKYREFSLTPFKKILENVNYKPLILHICGDTSHLIDLMLESGAAGLSLDSQVNFNKIKDRTPANVALVGNLDPTQVFLNSTPEQVAIATRHLKEEMSGVNNFILSSGCDIPLATPFANIEAFMGTAREEVVEEREITAS